MFRHLPGTLAVVGLLVIASSVAGQQIRVPHHQDKPPGPALSPQEAIAKMEVPEGFTVELVASEPDLVNPVAMTFDDRGRIWVCESLEYPRRSPGKGRDRVKILEDVDRDGRVDKSSVFLDGLNIPSGIALGHGGVWVANSPDILFVEDTDGDGRADKKEVVVTGFGRRDTHELPNSLTWGPDGWLYGLNGVFNHSHVRYSKENPNYEPDHPGWKFTCAMFRIHPRTREFQVFAEGTSNPWGIAFDEEGSAFVSACVIDHLWHITESGYYHRQGGPYPPHTWKIGSIVAHKHQKAAYCGLEYFDSDAYPEKYRRRLYMGNIHGGCVNVDELTRRGSTYFAKPNPDFLTANDAWFMPVDQRTGPDGFLYILDWYDRYHCYQDANRDPEGIDRLKGRIYRVRYGQKKPVPTFNLHEESDEQLIERLGSPNIFFRRKAQRILAERADSGTRKILQSKPYQNEPAVVRRHALWALIGSGFPSEVAHLRLLNSKDPLYRAWGVRAAGDLAWEPVGLNVRIQSKVEELATDPSADVRLQVAIAAPKLEEIDPVATLLTVLAHSGDDRLIPHIVWQNLYPLLNDERSVAEYLRQVERRDLSKEPAVADIVPRVLECLLDRSERDFRKVGELIGLVGDEQSGDRDAAGRCLSILRRRVQTRQIAGDELAELKDGLQPFVEELLSRETEGALVLDAALLATTWNDPAGRKAVRSVLALSKTPTNTRLAALDALIAAGDDSLLKTVDGIFSNRKANPAEFRARVLASLGRLNDPAVADTVLVHYQDLEPELKPRAVELLTQRVPWAKRLLVAIGNKQVSPNVLNLNQVRRLLATGDEELAAFVRKHWGTVREERDPEREEYIARMKQFIRQTPGDPFAGRKAFTKVCGQCHTMYGQGEEVGPDITLNGRNSFDQLLSNVFDPSLVIGAAYRAHTLVTADGRVLTGLLVEETPQRVVLKVQGGKRETVARGDVAVLKESKVSMMPEDVEKQLKPQEIADLFAYLVLDRPPEDPDARRLPGVREVEPRSSSDPKEFGSILNEVAPGFGTKAVGEGGVALLKQHRGRAVVVRTHPVGRSRPCVLRGRFELPAGKKSQLALSVSHHRQGDWRLIVKIDGETALETLVGPKTTNDGWAEHTVDLSAYAGKTVDIELHNDPNDWSYEFAYWGRAAVLTE